MLAELNDLFGPDAALAAVAGTVPAEFCRARVLAPAELVLDEYGLRLTD